MKTMNIDINTHVLYDDEECKVIWIYESGFCEIYSDNKVKLVRIEELQQIDHEKKG